MILSDRDIKESVKAKQLVAKSEVNADGLHGVFIERVNNKMLGLD